MSDSVATAPLSQNIRVLSGFAFPSASFNHLEGMPLIRIRDLANADTEVRFRGQYDPAYLIKKGDVLIGMDGDFEVHRWTGDDALLNQRTCKVEAATRQIDQRFLFWYLKRRVAEIHRRTPQTTVRHLSASDLYAVPVPSIGAAEQSVVAQILDILDTAIHETEAIIAKLKAVKQGLLHDLLTRGIAANGELRPPQAEAPHLYKPSPLGWIPKEWTFGPLQIWLDGKPKNGYSPQEAGAWTGIQMLGLGCLTVDGFRPVQLKPAPRGDRRIHPAFLSEGDLLMSRSNTRDLVGLVGIYHDVGTPCSYPDLMMRLRPSPESSAQYLQFVLQSPELRRQIQARAVGTSGSMVKISGKIVSGLSVAMPDKPEQEAALERLAPADSRLSAETEKFSLLRQVKTGLMDDLLTGRVRVTPLLHPAATIPA